MAPRRSSVRVELLLDTESEPISGALIHADGRCHQFSGWIELTAALEEARLPDGLDVIAHGEEHTGASGPDDDHTAS